MLTLIAAWHAIDGRNAPAKFFQIQRLLSANLIQQFMQHLLHRRRIHSCRSDFHSKRCARQTAQPQIRYAAVSSANLGKNNRCCAGDSSSTIASAAAGSPLSAPHAASAHAQTSTRYAPHADRRSTTHLHHREDKTNCEICPADAASKAPPSVGSSSLTSISGAHPLSGIASAN